MATTFTFTSDAAPGDEPIISQTFCRVITIQEKDVVGTVNLLIREPTKTSPQILVPAGQKYSFRGGGYTPGAIIAYISVSAGSATIQQIESNYESL